MGEGWSNDRRDGPRGTPRVHHRMGYAHSGKATLICVGANDGREVWRISMDDLGGKIPNWGYAESVLIDGDQLVCTPGSDKGAIAALDKLTGKVRWQCSDLTDPAHYSSIIKA